MILLGLGLSTALLAYMFLNSFGKDEESYGDDSYGYYSRKGYRAKKDYRSKVIQIECINLLL